jgi:phosphohistidine phosphatase
MRRLMLLRHAKSDRTQPGLRDHDRPLNERGRAAVPRIGAYMARHRLMPGRVVVSSSARTRETWALLAAAFAKRPPAVFEGRIYEAGPEAILEVIGETPAKIRSLLVIGHNPGLQVLALTLVGTGDAEARRRLAEKFPTGALAVIDFKLDDWRRLGPSTGALERFIAPRELAAAAD